MPLPCEGVQLLRSTRRLKEVVSNSGHEQEFCLFNHMWKFGTSSANMHNEVAPERGPPPAAVAEERWKLFSLIEEGLTRSDAVASMLSEQRVLRPGCLLLVGTSCLHVPSYQVFRCCNGPDQEFFFVDQEHYVKRPDLIACGWIAVRVLLPKRQEKWLNHFGTLAVKAVVVDSHTELWRLGMSSAVMHSAVALLTTFFLAVLNSRVGVGIWKLSSVLASMLLDQRVSSLPGNLHVPGVNEEQQGVCDLRLNAGGFFFIDK